MAIQKGRVGVVLSLKQSTRGTTASWTTAALTAKFTISTTSSRAKEAGPKHRWATFLSLVCMLMTCWSSETITWRKTSASSTRQHAVVKSSDKSQLKLSGRFLQAARASMQWSSQVAKASWSFHVHGGHSGPGQWLYWTNPSVILGPCSCTLQGVLANRARLQVWGSDRLGTRRGKALTIHGAGGHTQVSDYNDEVGVPTTCE